MKSVESYIDQYRSFQLHKVVNYEKFNHFAITAHSTQIEGSTLTVEETSLLIDEGITPKGKPLEHSLMVKDHHKALQLAIELGIKKRNITLQTICNLNAAVMESTGQQYNTPLGNIDAKKGELRKGSILVQKRYFPAYNNVPNLLDILCNELNEKMKQKLSVRKQVNLSYSAHFNLVSIHPHYDGNGRTSRLLMNQIQTRFNLPLSCVYKEDKKEYFNALEESRETERLAPFRAFMDDQYKKYLSAEIERYQSQNLNKKSEKGMNFLF
ncbi:MAG: Fic family protein [Cyclobacteriaceae bacterium]|nr:Fic family protein [Cyclobacteriaceae bacterium]